MVRGAGFPDLALPLLCCPRCECSGSCLDTGLCRFSLLSEVRGREITVRSSIPRAPERSRLTRDTHGGFV